jgi:hypothetical protein
MCHLKEAHCGVKTLKCSPSQASPFCVSHLFACLVACTCACEHVGVPLVPPWQCTHGMQHSTTCQLVRRMQMQCCPGASELCRVCSDSVCIHNAQPDRQTGKQASKHAGPLVVVADVCCNMRNTNVGSWCSQTALPGLRSLNRNHELHNAAMGVT